MHTRKLMALVGGLFFVLVAMLALPIQAQAAPPNCPIGWYVNPDEGNLKPAQKPQGMVFDGPSLIHHAASGKFSDAPGDGSFVAIDVSGSKPLFKMETSAPYSTVNKTPDGKFWSSKISSGDGSQGSPVDTIAALAALAPYTEDTVLLSFGVGYANDSGNKATVTSVHFDGKTYDMTCETPLPQKPIPTPKPTPTPTPSATQTPGVVPPVPVPPHTGTSLPVTGPSLPLVVGVASTALLIGIGLYASTRRRRNRFTA